MELSKNLMKRYYEELKPDYSKKERKVVLMACNVALYEVYEILYNKSQENPQDSNIYELRRMVDEAMNEVHREFEKEAN